VSRRVRRLGLFGASLADVSLLELKEAHLPRAQPAAVAVVRFLAWRRLVIGLIYTIASSRSVARRSMQIVDVDEAPLATALLPVACDQALRDKLHRPRTAQVAATPVVSTTPPRPPVMGIECRRYSQNVRSGNGTRGTGTSPAATGQS
jgi:hypothetical protein